MVRETARPDRSARAWVAWQRRAGLVAGIAMMGLFAFVVAPAVQRWEPVRAVHRFIEDRGIDAAALFYTESEEFGRVQRHMQDAERFPPCPSQGGSRPTARRR